MSSSHKPELKLDWCSHAAAKYACEHWHYSGCTPKFKQLWIGVWENRRFIGCIALGRSSTPYLGDAVGLTTVECCELTRVALTAHKAPVSQMVGIALRMVRKQSPGMRLVVSLADPAHGHMGGIYQAGNWIYIGRSSPMTQYYFRGKWRNDTSLMRLIAEHPELRRTLPTRRIEGKHKYLMPLDDEMRRQIEPLRKPYPKKASEAGDGEVHSHSGGAAPTRTLQLIEAG